MSAEAARTWLKYAMDHLELGRMAMGRDLLNPALQNAQQAVEKSLKAVWVLKEQMVRKTHYIADLVEDLASVGVDAGLSPQECDLLDSIYLPSKYPTGSALPDGFPTVDVTAQCIQIAERVVPGPQARLKRHEPRLLAFRRRRTRGDNARRGS